MLLKKNMQLMVTKRDVSNMQKNKFVEFSSDWKTTNLFINSNMDLGDLRWPY